MMTTLEAIYEKGKLVLAHPLPLPENTPVRVTVEMDGERAAWIEQSEQALTRTWDNPSDDVFNDLLEK